MCHSANTGIANTSANCYHSLHLKKMKSSQIATHGGRTHSYSYHPLIGQQFFFFLDTLNYKHDGSRNFLFVALHTKGALHLTVSAMHLTLHHSRGRSFHLKPAGRFQILPQFPNGSRNSQRCAVPSTSRKCLIQTTLFTPNLSDPRDSLGIRNSLSIKQSNGMEKQGH